MTSILWIALLLVSDLRPITPAEMRFCTPDYSYAEGVTPEISERCIPINPCGQGIDYNNTRFLNRCTGVI